LGTKASEGLRISPADHVTARKLRLDRTLAGRQNRRKLTVCDRRCENQEKQIRQNDENTFCRGSETEKSQACPEGIRQLLGAIVGRWVGANENRVPEADALLFEAIKEPASPDKFRGEDAKSEENDQPAGTRRENHHSTERKKSETKENLEPPLCLLHGLNQHREYPIG
jgi:hypothetical protein